MNAPLMRPSRLRLTPSRFGTIAILCALAFPTVAQAHSSSSVIAIDDVARLARPSVATGVTARVIDGNRKLELSVLAPRTAVVIGYGGEPFLRFARAGVFVNERSLTAVTNKLTSRGAVPGLDAGSRPQWQLIVRGHRFAWHDHRLALAPGLKTRNGYVGDWSIPLEVDGKPLRIEGGLWHARGPLLWPWLAFLAAVLGAGTALAIRGNPRQKRNAAYGCATVAGTSFLLAASGFTLTRSTGSRWASLVIPAAVAVGALAVFLLQPHLRTIVAGIVGVVVVAESSRELSVFGHGFVISALPAGVTRIAVAVALAGGLVTSIVVLAGLLRDDAQAARGANRPAKRPVKPPPRFAVPKGRQR
jgi:hypothetical protein